jgi:pimeloyl-ACP methyl ester carboxylesterase
MATGAWRVAGWATGLALVLLAVPLALRVAAGGTALRFLVEFVSDGAKPWLSATTDPPARELWRLPSGDAADLWRSPDDPPHRGLVLVHGLTPEGKEDPRLVWAAGLLARAGFAVVVPELPAMRDARLRPGDARVVTAAITRLAAAPQVRRGGLVVVGVSVGAAPALAAASAPNTAREVRLVVSLGGYADARELIRYFTTGRYAFGEISGRVGVDPALAQAFLGANLDLVRDPADRHAVRSALAGHPLPPTAGPEARAVLAILANRSPDRVDALLAALPRETQRLLDALSPRRYVTRLQARLLIIHGRDDPAIPFTESLRLAAAAGSDRAQVALVGLLAHVGGQEAAWGQLRDLGRLWTALYLMLRS